MSRRLFEKFALHRAPSAGNVDKFFCAASDGNVDKFALHRAAIDGNVDKCKKLIGKGANLHAVDEDGCAPLHWAAQEGHREVCELFMSNGADVNVKEKDVGCEAEDRDRFFAQIRLKIYMKSQNGINKDARGDEGFTPLHKAAARGHAAVCALLMDKGAAVDATSVGNWTPLHFAARNNRAAVVSLLLEGGAQVDAVDEEGDTPLLKAAKAKCVAACMELIWAGASVNAGDADGQIPLFWAAGHPEVIPCEVGWRFIAPPSWGRLCALLIRAGASVDVQEQETPLPALLQSRFGEGFVKDLHQHNRASVTGGGMGRGSGCHQPPSTDEGQSKGQGEITAETGAFQWEEFAQDAPAGAPQPQLQNLWGW